MTKASGFGPLPQLVMDWESERALQKIFQAEDIPLSVVEQQNVHVPFVSMLGVFGRAARVVGDRGFGLSVGEHMSLASYGLWVQYSATAPTLGEALRRMVATVRFQHTAASLSLEHQGAFAIWRGRTPALGIVQMQHSDRVVYPMLRFVRHFLGPDWRPAWIELNYPRDSESGVIEARLPGPVRFGQSAIGVAIPVSLLSHPGPARKWPPVTLLDVEASETLPEVSEPLRSVFAIAVLRLMDGETDIEGTAKMAGLSMRSLQRFLRQEGVGYRDLLSRVRARRAMALLQETDLPVTEVALALGYSEHANFSRAFSRWLGCSPADYRRHAGQPGSPHGAANVT